MKDLTFQIEKMKEIRQAISEGDNRLKPRAAMLGMSDVVLEILAQVQMIQVRELDRKLNPPDGSETNAVARKGTRERSIEVVEMLQICANELENKTLFPSIDQTEVVLFTSLSKDDTIEKNASFLIREIIRTIARHK